MLRDAQLASGSLRSEEFVLHTNPAWCIVPVAPVKEPCRVASAELILLAEPVVTVAVEPPEVPPPDWFQLLYSTVTSQKRME